ncbi:MAG: PEGA domain-containing protein, partial [bacterium]|nr:PEGA domain-containing protein [bacterium]
DVSNLMKTSLLVISNPSGAKIYQDNKSINKVTPIEISPFTPGTYKFKIEKTGYISKEVSFEVKPNIKNELKVTLQKLQTEPKPEPKPEPEPEPEPEPLPMPPEPIPLPPVAKEAFLTIQVSPWAKIYIDGKYIDTTPIPKPIKVTSGSHTVKAENPQFPVWEETINFSAGQTIEKSITLKKETPPEPVPSTGKGFLKISVKPWAKLYIDDKYFDTTPIATPIPLSPGSHKIKLENPQCQVYEETIEITGGETLEKSIQLVYK